MKSAKPKKPYSITNSDGIRYEVLYRRTVFVCRARSKAAAQLIRDALNMAGVSLREWN